jgi:hypothetical protein
MGRARTGGGGRSGVGTGQREVQSVAESLCVSVTRHRAADWNRQGNEWLVKWTDGWMNGWMNEWMDEWMDE